MRQKEKAISKIPSSPFVLAIYSWSWGLPKVWFIIAVSLRIRKITCFPPGKCHSQASCCCEKTLVKVNLGKGGLISSNCLLSGGMELKAGGRDYREMLFTGLPSKVFLARLLEQPETFYSEVACPTVGWAHDNHQSRLAGQSDSGSSSAEVLFFQVHSS